MRVNSMIRPKKVYIENGFLNQYNFFFLLIIPRNSHQLPSSYLHSAEFFTMNSRLIFLLCFFTTS